MSEAAPITPQVGTVSDTAWINTDGTFGAIDSAPEQVRDLVSKKGYKSVADLASAYANAEKKFGVSPDRLLTMPKDETDTEGYASLYNRLGRPESPDKYDWDIQAPEGVTVDNDTLAEFGKVAHELGLNKTQAKKLVEFQTQLAKRGNDMMAEQSVQAEADSKAAQQSAWDELKKANNIKTDSEMADFVGKAKKIAEDVGFYETLEAKKLGDDPQIINALIELSKRVSDSALPRKVEASTPDKKQALNEIMNHPAFTDRMHPEHSEIIKRFHDLHR